MVQMNLSTKQHGHREQTWGCQEGGEKGEGWISSLELEDANSDFFFFLSFVLLGPHKQHMGVPWLGV